MEILLLSFVLFLYYEIVTKCHYKIETENKQVSFILACLRPFELYLVINHTLFDNTI